MLARTAEITQSAVGRVRSAQREHRIAVDFQEHLLDLDRGSTAAVVAAVYQPGGEAMRVGGDWYLVVPLQRPGQIAISVGDVVGHGLPAAIVMSRLRAAVAATALTGADPDAVLSLAGQVRGGGPRCALRDGQLRRDRHRATGNDDAAPASATPARVIPTRCW